MGKNVAKKQKISKAERKRAARRRRMIRNGMIYAGVVITCVACMVAISVLNRPVEPKNTWYVEDGALEIAAPGMTESGMSVASGAFTTTEGKDSDALRVLPAQVTESPTAVPTAVPTEIPTPTPTEMPDWTPTETARTITIDRKSVV